MAHRIAPWQGRHRRLWNIVQRSNYYEQNKLTSWKSSWSCQYTARLVSSRVWKLEGRDAILGTPGTRIWPHHESCARVVLNKAPHYAFEHRIVGTQDVQLTPLNFKLRLNLCPPMLLPSDCNAWRVLYSLGCVDWGEYSLGWVHQGKYSSGQVFVGASWLGQAFLNICQGVLKLGWVFIRVSWSGQVFIGVSCQGVWGWILLRSSTMNESELYLVLHNRTEQLV